jgi:putative hydrolase of the HAD superfamily
LKTAITLRGANLGIKWIFFDLGSTLIDETKAHNHRIKDMIEGTDISFDAYENKRIEYAKLGLEWDQETIKYYDLKKTPWHSEDEFPYIDSFRTLEYLKNQGYLLGVIANQVIGTSQRLAAWGLLDFFKVIVVSSEVGVSKPNKLIFEKAYELARCFPSESVMVGDRLDNDIKPAKSLGMRTVWIRQGLSKHQNEKLGNDTADWTIESIEDLKQIFK